MKQLQSQREDGTDDLDMKTITLDDGDASDPGGQAEALVIDEECSVDIGAGESRGMRWWLERRPPPLASSSSDEDEDDRSWWRHAATARLRLRKGRSSDSSRPESNEISACRSYRPTRLACS